MLNTRAKAALARRIRGIKTVVSALIVPPIEEFLADETTRIEDNDNAIRRGKRRLAYRIRQLGTKEMIA